MKSGTVKSRASRPEVVCDPIFKFMLLFQEKMKFQQANSITSIKTLLSHQHYHARLVGGMEFTECE